MLAYVIKRLLLLVLTLFGITVITFAVTRLTPGEPAPVAQGSRAAERGGYDALLEQNRRNLGLDKPMLLNLRFEDRTTVARQALADFARPARFWQQDAERRLQLSTTIALRPAIEYLHDLDGVSGRVDHLLQPTTDPQRAIDVEDARARLLDLLPTLAGERPADAPASTAPAAERLAYWEAFARDNAPRWSAAEVDKAVAAYLDGGADIREVLVRGGYAVPALVAALEGRDDDRALRANNALSGLTGFNFLNTPDAWAKERAEVTSKWRSFYRREVIRFTEYGPIGHTVNIAANTQFGVWFGQILFLDFGQSYKHRRPVNALILERLPITLLLSVFSIVLGYALAIPIGILSAARRDSVDDRVLTLGLFVLYSLPVFWVAQMSILMLTGGPTPWGGQWPQWFPTRGVNSADLDWTTGNPRAILDMLWHVTLPTLCGTYGSLAFLSRQMRSALLEVIRLDYIRTAQAKGLSPVAVVLRHGARNALIPILSLSSGLLPELIAGSIIIESIFTIPGMGLLSFEAILNRDYPVINAILFYSAALTLLGILLTDLAYAWVDPRIRYE